MGLDRSGHARHEPDAENHRRLRAAGKLRNSKERLKEHYLLRGGARQVLVKVDVNGTRGTFILDTGASYLTVNSAFADRGRIPQSAMSIMLSTANGLARGVLSKADKVRLGKLEAANVPTVVQKTDEKSYGPGIDGLLGMSFLSRFEVQLGSNFVEVRTRPPK